MRLKTPQVKLARTNSFCFKQLSRKLPVWAWLLPAIHLQPCHRITLSPWSTQMTLHGFHPFTYSWHINFQNTTAKSSSIAPVWEVRCDLWRPCWTKICCGTGWTGPSVRIGLMDGRWKPWDMRFSWQWNSTPGWPRCCWPQALRDSSASRRISYGEWSSRTTPSAARIWSERFWKRNGICLRNSGGCIQYSANWLHSRPFGYWRDTFEDGNCRDWTNT